MLESTRLKEKRRRKEGQKRGRRRRGERRDSVCFRLFVFGVGDGLGQRERIEERRRGFSADVCLGVRGWAKKKKKESKRQGERKTGERQGQSQREKHTHPTGDNLRETEKRAFFGRPEGPGAVWAGARTSEQEKKISFVPFHPLPAKCCLLVYSLVYLSA